MNEELLKKAKAAKSPEELLKMAHENGMADFDEESAKAYYDLINRSGELSDSELENAAGGCKNKGRTVVTLGHVCSWGSSWRCNRCHKTSKFCSCRHDSYLDGLGVSLDMGSKDVCATCDNLIKEHGLWLCTDEIVNSD